MKAFRFLAVMATITIMLLLGAGMSRSAVVPSASDLTPAFHDELKHGKLTNEDSHIVIKVAADINNTVSSLKVKASYSEELVNIDRMTNANGVASALTYIPQDGGDIHNDTGEAIFQAGGDTVTASGAWVAQPLVYIKLDYIYANWYKETTANIAVEVWIDETNYYVLNINVDPDIGNTGDLSGNGTVTLDDAILILEHLAGDRDLSTLGAFASQIGDPSNDGTPFTIYDAALIVQKVGETLITFPADEAGAFPAPPDPKICTLRLSTPELVSGRDIYRTQLILTGAKGARALFFKVSFDELSVLQANLNQSLIPKEESRGLHLVNVAERAIYFCLARLDPLTEDKVIFGEIEFQSEKHEFVLYPSGSDMDEGKFIVKEEAYGLSLVTKTLKPKPLKNLLLPNYPNPFNPETWMPFKLANDADVQILIYSIAGQLIRSIDLGRQNIGAHIKKSESAYWDGRNNFGELESSGIYFYNLRAGQFSATRKMVILK